MTEYTDAYSVEKSIRTPAQSIHAWGRLYVSKLEDCQQPASASSAEVSLCVKLAWELEKTSIISVCWSGYMLLCLTSSKPRVVLHCVLWRSDKVHFSTHPSLSGFWIVVFLFSVSRNCIGASGSAAWLPKLAIILEQCWHKYRWFSVSCSQIYWKSEKVWAQCTSLRLILARDQNVVWRNKKNLTIVKLENSWTRPYGNFQFFLAFACAIFSTSCDYIPGRVLWHQMAMFCYSSIDGNIVLVLWPGFDLLDLFALYDATWSKYS